MPETNSTPIQTALFDLHVAQGGRMVDFAGYHLPVQFSSIVAEHLHTRAQASLFDVSHMGQMTVRGPNDDATLSALETLLPGNLKNLKPGGMRYTVLLNREGGIEDDLIVTRPAQGQSEDGTIFIVVNAARKYHDLTIMKAHFEGELEIELHSEKALIALQGPLAATILAQHCDAPHELAFMQSMPAEIGGVACQISRCGYTGEDGFEISALSQNIKKIAELLYSDERLKPAGLGARDSLRLEAGLCLYGHDMNAQIGPLAANILFAIGKKRRTEGGFVGDDAVIKTIENGVDKQRVGVVFDGRLPVREGAPIVDDNANTIGNVTSGTSAPTFGAPIAFAYVPKTMIAPGTPITALVRGKNVTGKVSELPFVPQNYARQPGL